MILFSFRLTITIISEAFHVARSNSAQKIAIERISWVFLFAGTFCRVDDQHESLSNTINHEQN